MLLKQPFILFYLLLKVIALSASIASGHLIFPCTVSLYTIYEKDHSKSVPLLLTDLTQHGLQNKAYHWNLGEWEKVREGNFRIIVQGKIACHQGRVTRKKTGAIDGEPCKWLSWSLPLARHVVLKPLQERSLSTELK